MRMIKIFTHVFFRTNYVSAYHSFVLPLVICFALVIACWCAGCSRLSDMDDDKVADILDNCPATANTDQADTDGNGVGDACQGEGLATGETLAYSTPDGVAEAGFDQRLRSVRITSPGQVATLVWSDNSSRVDIELVVNRIRTTSSTPVDFSDAALLAALDAAEKDGVDVTVYRQYIADHPGQIQQIVTGQESPASALRNTRLEQQQQVLNPEVEKYLNRLNRAALICRATAWAFNQQTATEDPNLREHYATLVRHFVRLANELHDLYVDQQQECIICTENCNTDCTGGDPTDKVPMACCLYEYVSNTSECVETDEEDCVKNRLGEFHEGFTCEDIDHCETGACCVDFDDPNPEPPDFNQKPTCSKTTRQTCDQMANTQGPLPVYTDFHVGLQCSEVTCEE